MISRETGHAKAAHLVALDALRTASAVQRGRLEGEALVSTRLAHVLISGVDGSQVRLPCRQADTSDDTHKLLQTRTFRLPSDTCGL